MTQRETVRPWIGDAPHIAVLTGAGMSAESGVPTFRDALTGLWAQQPAGTGHRRRVSRPRAMLRRQWQPSPPSGGLVWREPAAKCT